MTTSTNTRKATSQPQNTEAPTTKKARSVAHEVVDNTADRAERLEGKLREEAARMSEKASVGKDEAREKWDETIDQVDRWVRERPAASIGIAFGAGVLATLLLRR